MMNHSENTRLCDEILVAIGCCSSCTLLVLVVLVPGLSIYAVFPEQEGIQSDQLKSMKQVVKTQYIYVFAEIVIGFLMVCCYGCKKQRLSSCLLFTIFVVIAKQFFTLWQQAASIYEAHD